MKTTCIAAVLALWGASAQADVRLANIFTDHAVLQRGQPIQVWGWANPGEAVKVSLHSQSASTVADAKGNWQVALKAESAGGPFQMTVQGSNRISLQDILVGEVWLASGQSNMEWSVADAKDGAREVAQSAQPQIRHFKVPKSVAMQPVADMGASGWKVADPANTGEFSAVAYFFARKLQGQLHVPVGIINSSWGGTNVETWISPGKLSAYPEYDMASMPKDVGAYRARYEARMRGIAAKWQGSLPVDGSTASTWKESDLDDKAWPTLQVPKVWEEQGMEDFDGVVWFRKTIDLTPEQAGAAATLHLGTIDDADETWVNGQKVGASPDWDMMRHYPVPVGVLKAGRNVIAVRVDDQGGDGGFYGDAANVYLQTSAGNVPLAGAWKARVEGFPAKKGPAPNDLPTVLFNSMIQPITSYAVRGAIWYQGESNVPRAQQYTQSFARLIEDWRGQWKNPQMPFYFVQLASFLPLEKNTLAGSTWAELRDAQRQTLRLPHTGMAVTIDVGDANDIHPRNKQAVGARLALLALKNDYGKRSLVTNGPVFKSARVKGSTLVVSFADVAKGLVVGTKDAPLQGFAIADQSQKFVPAQARIQGNTVVVSSPQVSHPVAVRYGWVDNPEQSNLFNSERLPASPFRSDNWPWLTQGVKYSY